MESLLTYAPNRFGGFSINNFILNKLNMETKEFKVQAPEGYEIDREKSTLDCIKFKPINKAITYEDVCRKLFNHTYYFTNERGEIDTYCEICKSDPNNAINRRQLERILALNQLLTIAEYYNRLHPKQNNNLYYITLEHKSVYYVGHYYKEYSIPGLIVVFNNEEDANSVINNPNFRKILDIIYKD